MSDMAGANQFSPRSHSDQVASGGELADGLTLHVRDDIGAPTAERQRSPAERVLDALGDATAPLTRRELRDTCRLRNATLVDTLAALQADGRVRVDAGQIQLAIA